MHSATRVSRCGRALGTLRGVEIVGRRRSAIVSRAAGMGVAGGALPALLKLLVLS
jgi:hypothetical protein